MTLFLILMIYIIILLLLYIITSPFIYYFMFKKAGRSAIDGLVPIYNEICSFTIAGLPNWLVFLYLIPFLNIGLFIYKNFMLAGKFTNDFISQLLITIFPIIGFPYLGLSKLEYRK